MNQLRDLLGDAPEWRDLALCREADPDAWFPEPGNSAHAAKRICRRCPVRVECLTYALDTRQPDGVWGGKSERERHKLIARSTSTCRRGHERTADNTTRDARGHLHCLTCRAMRRAAA